jgi:chemotaxis protein MotD
MNAALPAILQQSSAPAPHAARGRNGTASEGGSQGFGELLKPEGGAKGGASVTKRDGHEAATAEPSGDPELLAKERSAADGKAGPVDRAKPDKAPEEGEDERETTESAETLLPFLTVAEPSKPVAARQGDTAEATPGLKGNNAASPAAKIRAKPMEDVANEGQPVVVLQNAESAPASRRPETTFGKHLIANLNDLATQAPDRPDVRIETRNADGQAVDSLGDALGARRGRGTLTADAVSRAREPQEAGGRRADPRPIGDQKGQTAPLAQLPLSTGVPVVQALAGNPAPVAAPLRAAEATSQAGQAAPATTQALKIQLQPVELGMVTANLRITGEQLSVEIEVESVEAYNRLSSETDAIARALRSHGIAVEEVVIQAPQIHAVPPARDGAGGFADTASNSGRNFSAGAESGQPGGSGHPNRDAGRDNGHETEKLSPTEQRTASGSTRGGVYI